MAVGRFSVLLRNGSHYQLSQAVTVYDGNTTPPTPAGIHWGVTYQGAPRYGVALKCDNVAISYSKTPIQIPIPQRSPEIIDLGIFRPSITLSGLVENSGTSVDPFMDNISVTSRTSEYSEGTFTGTYTAKYYLPYKNILENIVFSWISKNSTDLELQLGDVDVPYGNTATGGANYKVAIQQCRFQQNAAQEDRWTFSMQLIAKAREDYEF